MGANLGQLLEAEQGFAARVDAARREARLLVEAARSEAEALRGDSAEALTRKQKAIADEEDRALAAELARLDAETAAHVERLGSVSETRVAALADQVLRTLLEGGCA